MERILHLRDREALLAKDGKLKVVVRAVKPQPPIGWERHCWFNAPVYGWTCEPEPAENWHKVRCPFGAPGTVLAGKENYWQAARYPGSLPSGDPEPESGCWGNLYHYAADGNPENTPNRHYPNGLRGGAISAPDPYAIWRKRSPVTMPTKLIRRRFTVKSVRAMTVHDWMYSSDISPDAPLYCDHEQVDAMKETDWLWYAEVEAL